MKVLVIGKPTYNIILPNEKFLIEGSKNQVSEKFELAGGASVYASILLAKWGCDVTFAGVIGNDPYGQKIKGELERAGVDTKFLEINYEHKTSVTYTLINKENGSATTLYQDMNVNLLKYKYDFNPDFIIIDGTDMDGATAALNNYPQAKTCFLANVVNNEYYNISKRCNYVVSNMSFAKALTKMEIELNKSKSLVNFFQKIKDLNKAEYVVTLKENGVLYTKDREVKMLPSVSVKVVDDSNAGKGFFAGYCYGLINNYDKDICIKIANTTAALSMTKYGTSGIPELSKVLNILNIKEEVETLDANVQNTANNLNEQAVINQNEQTTAPQVENTNETPKQNNE